MVRENSDDALILFYFFNPFKINTGGTPRTF
jgi:hypothetical protein